MDKMDILIIGAGVVGLAVAAELARANRRCTIALMERHDSFGLETSSRNSEVIHAGIYYPPGTLKAALCVEGNSLLYRFCEQRQIPHRRLGKLVVARDETEIPALQALLKLAEDNGVPGMEMLDARQAAHLEPFVRARAALLSPSTGIVDAYRLMSCLEQLALQEGVLFAYRHTVTGIESRGNGYRVSVLNPDGSGDTLDCVRLVNCAGLAADRVASMTGIDINEAGYRVHPCKGEYFSVSRERAKLVSRLIYPPPLDELAGLGVHLTRSLDGRLRLGPNACYVDTLEYSVNPGRAGEFFEAAQTFLPFLELSDLEPEMAGIRPKLQGPGQPFRDFVIRHEADRSLPGLVNLLGIESPGLTCCLSIARLVAQMLM